MSAGTEVPAPHVPIAGITVRGLRRLDRIVYERGVGEGQRVPEQIVLVEREVLREHQRHELFLGVDLEVGGRGAAPAELPDRPEPPTSRQADAHAAAQPEPS